MIGYNKFDVLELFDMSQNEKSTLGSIVSFFTGKGKSTGEQQETPQFAKNTEENTTTHTHQEPHTDHIHESHTHKATNNNNNSENTQQQQQNVKKHQHGKGGQTHKVKTLQALAIEKEREEREREIQEKNLEISKGNLIDMLLDPPVRKLKFDRDEMTKLMYSPEVPDIDPDMSMWICGVLGGTIGYFLSNSFLKHHPIKSISTLGTIAATGAGAYILSNGYEKANSEMLQFYRKNQYDIEVQRYFLSEMPLIFLENKIKRGEISDIDKEL
ncbi:hypothetical protein DLAC_07598 [Tieghemostelium lacteum]|uniref:Uncharacterized protein n=1 Tax=Tieghemostelium lacteum TaxID=361077 RepID=A0A151ZCW9_TIELA|nr:hypothetical protein DLAC_07598 [Tieghemostelium lacteum]|eukprot:KYQ91802.1 hypothetical protein DLAC_07598 [Tieghemostelium lacteum]